MTQGSFRAFSLYDFFSVFLPGVSLIIGLYPLAPEELTNSINISLGIPILFVGGFIFGQAIHGTAVGIQSKISKTHYDILEKKLIPGNEPYHPFYFLSRRPLSSENQNKLMKQGLESVYDGDRFSTFDAEGDDIDLSNTKFIYKLIRSNLSVDGRGKARHLQAIYAFCRSMWLSSLYLFILYTSTFVFATQTQNIDFSAPFFSLSQDIPYVGGSILLVLLSLSGLFAYESGRYKTIYIDYLVMDFINCERTSDENSA
jgi:hypothetical protein